MTEPRKCAVILLQLGGPDSLDAVEPFLFNLFSDPDIIDFPGAFLARKVLARFIARKRAPYVAERYKLIGGKSPIIDLTFAQALALEKLLNPEIPLKVFVAMRYWNPLTREVVNQLAGNSYSRAVLLPLYPHYSKATTLSSIKEWRRNASALGGLESSTICCYYNHPLYIEALVANINAAYAKFTHCEPKDIQLVFSAHGVPLDLIRKGDPYQLQIEETVRHVMEKGKWASPHRLCYQSKVGPAAWLKPSLPETIEDLARNGRRNLLVIPIAFVTDHIETLHEINIEAREEAGRLGIHRFEMMPALNTNPLFIECLADLVRHAISGESLHLSSCRDLHRSHPDRFAPHLCPYWNSSRP